MKGFQTIVRPPIQMRLLAEDHTHLPWAPYTQLAQQLSLIIKILWQDDRI